MTLLISLAVITLAIKSAGPLVLGNSQIPGRLAEIVESTVVAVLIVLVVVAASTDNGGFVMDARVIGLVAAALALVFRASIPVAVMLAIFATALTRAFT